MRHAMWCEKLPCSLIFRSASAEVVLGTRFALARTYLPLNKQLMTREPGQKLTHALRTARLSQARCCEPAPEGVAKELFPRSRERGLIEGSYILLRPMRLFWFPRSRERGLIEGGLHPASLLPF